MSRPRDPKPCPRCYAPMRVTADGFECAKHGIPPPDRPVVVAARPVATAKVVKKKAREPRGPTVPRVHVTRPRKNPRYPSDYKTYPLPPAGDGRSHGRTSEASPTTARSLLTPALLARATEESRAGMSPHAIAVGMWEEAGFASHDACKGSLYRALRIAGVIPRSAPR